MVKEKEKEPIVGMGIGSQNVGLAECNVKEIWPLKLTCSKICKLHKKLPSSWRVIAQFDYKYLLFFFFFGVSIN